MSDLLIFFNDRNNFGLDKYYDAALYVGSDRSVPEPGALVLMCAGMLGAFAARRSSLPG